MLKVHSIVCALCGGGEFDHRRDNGECHRFAHVDTKPYALSRRDKTPAKGWVVR